MFKRTKIHAGLLAAFGSGSMFPKPPVTARQATLLRAMRLSVPALAGAVFNMSALAQSAAPASSAASSPAADAPQRVEITGSMLARTNAETSESVTVITADSLKAQGVTTIEQALQRIAANQSGQVTASSVGTFDGGASLAGLRGLDAGKTLVLLDGQRLANNVVSGDAVDLNLIPFAAIDRIEVLKEGASSIYGADAIAGVINFITKKDYQAGELDLSASRSQLHGGNTHSASLTWGKGSLSTDGYNIMAAANFNNTGELRGYERSYSSGYNPNIGLAISNSPGTWPGNYVDSNGNSFQVNGAGCPGNPFPTHYLGKCDYLYAEAVDLIPKSDQYSGLFSVSKALPGNNTLTAQYYIAKSKITAWGGPMFYEFNMSPTEDPTYFPTAANSTLIGGGTATPNLTNDVTAIWTDPLNNRYNTYDNTEQRLLLTLTGEHAGWNYSTNASYTSNKNIQSGTGYPNETILETPDGNYLNNLINPFGPQSAAGQALINSSYDNGTWATGKLSSWDINSQVSHDLPNFFHTVEAPSVAIGLDVRSERISYNTTPLAAVLQNVTGFPPTSVVGTRNEEGVYGEMSLPVTKQLELTLSDREDRYSDFGYTNNGKLAFRFQPSTFVTFRGAASTGFRAPTLVNLFSPTTLGAAAGDMNGPGCSANSGSPTYPTIFTQTTCNSQGLVLSGGNRLLKPELSDNFDLGIVLAPVKNLGITLDWYRIVITKDISTVPTSTIYANPGQFQNLYHLNNAGTLTPSIAQANDCPTLQAATCGYIETNLANVGGRQTNGWDLDVSYLLHSSTGNYRFGLDGTLVTEFLRQSYAGAPWTSVLGNYAGTNQVVVPWQSTLSLDWDKDIWAAGVSEHFDSQYRDQQLLSDGGVHIVKAYSVYNVYGSVKPVPHVKVLLGVHNLFNRNPPATNQYVSNFQLGYNPLLGDPTGRAIYATLNVEF
jgi:iron complex outermembrane receptor protein